MEWIKIIVIVGGILFVLWSAVVMITLTKMFRYTVRYMRGRKERVQRNRQRARDILMPDSKKATRIIEMINSGIKNEDLTPEEHKKKYGW